MSPTGSRTVPRQRPRRAEDGCPGERRTVTCHAGRAAAGPHPPTPAPRPDPAGSASRASYDPAARAGGPRRPGAPEGCCSCRAIGVPVLGSAVRAGGNLRATRTPVGPLGMRSAPALVRRSPGFRRSSERRREVGPARPD